MRRLTKTFLKLLVVMFTMAFAVPGLEAGEKLQAKTKDAWNKYEQLTQKRIDRELAGPGPFLQLFGMKDAEAKIARAELDKGRVQVKKMPPTQDSGKEINVENGLIYHWYGVIFVPKTNVAMVLKWV